MIPKSSQWYARAMDENLPTDQPKKYFVINPIIDKLHAEKDTWRTFAMAIGALLSIALLAGAILGLLWTLLKGLL